MAKKLSKSAKLDLIVTELAKVKTELKKLSKQHTALAGELNKRIRPAAPTRKPAKKTAQKAQAPAAKAAPVREAAPKRPVLIQSPAAPPAAGRAG
jgi:hypothetical protein